MKRKIGCDIDGCLNLFHKNLIKIAAKNYGVYINDDGLVDSLIIEAMGFITSDEKKVFFEKHYEETKDPLVFPGAKETLDQLISEGSQIYLITARTYDIGKLTENWLKKHNFNYHQLVLSAGNKIDACKWKDVDIMIEDNPYNIQALLDGGIKVLMPVHGYNKHMNHENLIHCSDWNEIYQALK